MSSLLTLCKAVATDIVYWSSTGGLLHLVQQRGAWALNYSITWMWNWVEEGKHVCLGGSEIAPVCCLSCLSKCWTLALANSMCKCSLDLLKITENRIWIWIIYLDFENLNCVPCCKICLDFIQLTCNFWCSILQWKCLVLQATLTYHSSSHQLLTYWNLRITTPLLFVC